MKSLRKIVLLFILVCCCLSIIYFYPQKKSATSFSEALTNDKIVKIIYYNFDESIRVIAENKASINNLIQELSMYSMPQINSNIDDGQEGAYYFEVITKSDTKELWILNHTIIYGENFFQIDEEGHRYFMKMIYGH